MINIFTKIARNRFLIFKLILLVLIATLYLNRAGYEFENDPYIEGDGFEYVLMTESFYNHFSPDLQKQDILSFKNSLIKENNWDTFFKKEIINDLIITFNKNKYNLKENQFGFFYSKQKKFYSYHFYTYSLFCLPIKVIGKWCGSPVLHAFYKTNALLVIITCFLFLFYFSKNNFIAVFSSLCFCFSSCYWYLGWEHAEIFTTCFVAWGLISFFNKKHLLGLLFIALATSQNQTLMILLAFLAFIAVYNKKFNLKYLLLAFLVCIVAFIPIAFYYYHFNTTNLIKDLGYLDNKYITTTRLFGFYFDLNQGMILAMPLILISYIILYLKNLIANYKKPSFDMLLPFVCIIMTLIGSSMGNWNPSESIVHRYTTWIGAIIFIHTFYLLEKSQESIKLLLLSSFFWSQVIVCFYFQTINKFDWEQLNHKDIAIWMLDNYPEMYSPDPIIFSVRTDNEYQLSRREEPVIYFDKKRKIKKVMFNVKHISALQNYCGTIINFTKFSNYKNNYNWAYMNASDLKLLKSDDEIYSIIRHWKVGNARYKLLTNPTWLEQIKKKASDWKMTVDQVLDLDAEYLVKQEEELKFK